MAMLSVNGTQLFVERTEAPGPPLVLVHGSWVDHHDWDALVPELAPSFHVVTYDRRGHSQSPRPPGQGSIREDVADLAALIERLGLAPAHLVGNSFGGIVALRLASERPELVESLSVHEPPLFGLLAHEPAFQAPLAGLRQHLGVVEARLRAGDDEGAARHFIENIAFGPGAWEALPEPLRRTVVTNGPTFLDELQDPEWPSLDLRAVARFPRSMLLTRGGQSPQLLGEIVKFLCHALPHAAQHVFVNDGHVPHETHPAAYAHVVGAHATGVGIATGHVPDTHPLPAH